MAKKGIGPGPKQSKPVAGSRTDSAGMQYFGRQVANAMNAQKPAAAKKPAAKKPAAPAPAPKKAAAPAPAVAAKKPVSKRAFMDVDMGPNKKGMRHTMSLDTTNMSNPNKIDTDTYNYIIKDSTGKVTSKGNIARGNSKYATKQVVEKLKLKAKK